MLGLIIATGAPGRRTQTEGHMLATIESEYYYANDKMALCTVGRKVQQKVGPTARDVGHVLVL
jgi:hypothetical protein